MKKVLLLALIIPAVLFGQKTNDLIIALQRDMSDLQEKMKTLQKSQDEKLAAIQGMVQQAVDASTRAAQGLTTLQHEVDSKLTDQQTKLVAPVATLGSKVDQMSDEFRAVSTTVSDLRLKINALDGKLTDISNAIRILNTPPPSAPASATPQTQANPCAGTSAESLWQSARRDKSGGDADLAMKEYMEYVTCFPETANAPVAQWEIGMMYFNGGNNYDDAVKAFDVVLERFPENPKTQEALYYKAVSLMKAGHNTEAGKTFKDYLAHYKSGDHVANAHANLRTLGMEHAPPRPKH